MLANLINFLKKPLDDKLYGLERHCLYRFKNGYHFFGKYSVIHNPMMLHGKKYISIGNNVMIRDGARIECIDTWSNPPKRFNPCFIIDDNVNIEQRFHVACSCSIHIHSSVTIAPDVMILDCAHSIQHIDSNILSNPLEISPVEIKEYSFIGAGVKILPGVTIGKNTIIGANSVVNRSIPDYSIAVGAPAKVIKKYNSSNNKWERVI